MGLLKRNLNYGNIGIIDLDFLDSNSGIPMMYKEDVHSCSRFISFNHALSFRDSRDDVGVHFYIDDYQFERVWNFPNKYIDILKSFSVVTSPDFSMFLGMPYPMQIWNHYRSQALAQYWQNHGVRVIPSLNWADESSYEFSFSGIPKHGTVSVSTVGTLRSENSCRYWQLGMAEAVKRLEPTRIFAYGDPLEFNAGGAEVVWFRPEHLERMRKHSRKKQSRNMNVRTEFLMNHPEFVSSVGDKFGIPQRDMEDFHQEVLCQSLRCRCQFDAAKSDISTYSYRFVKFIALKMLNQMEHFLPLYEELEGASES